MERPITGKRPSFRPDRQRSSFYRIMLWLSLILAGVWVLLSYRRGQIEAPFQPTPTPTRNAQSYIMEAQAYFDAGKLDDPDPPSPTPPHPDAIDTYQKALKIDPKNAQAWAELARIATYSSSMLRNDTERLARLKDAVSWARKAVELAPDSSLSHAILAFTLDWYASNSLVSPDESQRSLSEANNEAVIAYQLDPNNALALAYYAEVLNDQQRWLQAEKYAQQAAKEAPDLMDTHRVYAYIEESLGNYKTAIEEYQAASQIAPNLTFLYIRIGQNYREGIKNPDKALEYFDRAARINEYLNVQNPIPYIEIAKTYSQQGQFLTAARNAEKALSYDPTNATTYGQLGITFIQARNYEGAMTLLKCAVKPGCTAAENEMGKVDVQGLPLSNKTVAYYYVEYGTVMAFLSRPHENYCDQAMPVLEEVRTTYPDDTILQSIVQDSEGICRRLQKTPSSSVGSSPTSTPVPGTAASTFTPDLTPSTPTPGGVTPRPSTSPTP